MPTDRFSPLALAVLLSGGFMTIFDVFVVNVALPNIRAEFGASFGTAGLVVAAYELTFGVLLIVGARLGDRHGRRQVFALGLAGFAAASLLCSLAPDVETLVAARLLQGGTGALLFPQIYAILRVSLDAEERRRAFAKLGMTLGLAAIAGQVLGGLIVEADLMGLGWRLAFLLNLPVAGAGLLLIRRIPDSQAPEVMTVDWAGIGLAGLALLLLLGPLLEAESWSHWHGAALATAGPAFLLFGWWERRLVRRGVAPALDPALLAKGTFLLGVLVVLLIYTTTTALFLAFALMTQNGLGLSPLEAGLLFAPASLGFVAAAGLAPRLVARFGDAALLGGMLLYAAGLVWLGLAAWELTGAGEAWTLLSAILTFGIGQGLSTTPLLNRVVGLAEARQAGMAAGLVATVQHLGGALGVALAGGVFAAWVGEGAASLPDHVAAFARVLLVCAGAVVLAMAVLRAMPDGSSPSYPTPRRSV